MPLGAAVRRGRGEARIDAAVDGVGGGARAVRRRLRAKTPAPPEPQQPCWRPAGLPGGPRAISIDVCVGLAERCPGAWVDLLRWSPMSDVLAVARTTTRICQLARETAAELLLESPLQLIDLDPSDDTRIARIL